MATCFHKVEIVKRADFCADTLCRHSLQFCMDSRCRLKDHKLGLKEEPTPLTEEIEI
jgi:hypothetical protein